MKTIFSIGTNGSSPTLILCALLHYKITHLYDIRQDPDHHFARTKGRILKELFSERSPHIRYDWIPELAPSRTLTNRKKSERCYPSEYLEEIGETGLKRAFDLIEAAETPCFLASESMRYLNKSNRHTLLNELQRRHSDILQVKHVDGATHFKEGLANVNLHRGKVYDISEMFKDINSKYFNNRFREEDIIFAWEEMLKRTMLGYFWYPSLIALNSFLDRNEIPRAVTEAVLYHEMLHLDRAHRGLPSGHTVEFYLEEALFEKYSEQFHFDFRTVWNTLRKGDAK